MPLTIANDAALDWWGLLWGVQSRHYSSSANAALYYEAEGRTALGGSATAVGPTGASGGGSNVMRNTALLTTYQAILSTQATGAGAHLSHIGTYRVFARVQVPATNTGLVTVALEWGEGDFLQYTQNVPRTIAAEWEASWRLVDLGLIRPREVTQGTQKWEGRIIAKSTVTGDDIDVDWLMLIPADEGSGIASGVERRFTPTVISARDEYTGTTAGNALNTRAAPVGGTWATSGAATDFLFADPIGNYTTEHIVRTATGTRFAILGSTNYTNVDVSTICSSASPTHQVGVIARWTDSSNYLVGRVNLATLEIVAVVAGVETVIATAEGVSFANDALRRLRLAAYAGGRVVLTVSDLADVELRRIFGASTLLATGGTLATGKPGLSDVASAFLTNRYDDFLVSVPPPDAAVFAGQSLAISSSSVTREDAAGGVWSRVSSYAGDYLRVPPSGQEGRTARVIVKPLFHPEEAAGGVWLDDRIDDMSARLTLTPRFLVVPS